MNLVRDLLDKAVRDTAGHEMGRVDGIVLERRDGRRPRIAALVIGPSALGSRLHPRIGRCVAAIELMFGVSEGRPVRIAFSDVARIAEVVTIDVASADTAADAVERLARGWLRHLPGGR